MNTKEFEELVEKLREALVDEPTPRTLSRQEFIVRAREREGEVFINILDALPGTLLRIIEVYYFKLFDGWVAPDRYSSVFDDYEIAMMGRTAVENGARVELLNWPEE